MGIFRGCQDGRVWWAEGGGIEARQAAVTSLARVRARQVALTSVDARGQGPGSPDVDSSLVTQQHAGLWPCVERQYCTVGQKMDE